ncbi:Putative uncharacterized protein, partial [Moritella viscosa]
MWLTSEWTNTRTGNNTTAAIKLNRVCIFSYILGFN